MWIWVALASLALFAASLISAMGTLGFGSTHQNATLRQNHDTDEAVFLFKGLLFQVFTGFFWAQAVYERAVGYSLLPLAPVLGYAVWTLYLRRDGDSTAEHPRAAWLLSINAASLGIAAIWLGSGLPLFATPLVAPLVFAAFCIYTAEERFFPLLIGGAVAGGQLVALLATSISASVFEVPELDLSAVEAGSYAGAIVLFVIVQWIRARAWVALES